MTKPDNSTETQQPLSPAGLREAQQGDKRLTDFLHIDHGKNQIKKRTEDSLKDLKKNVYSLSLDARTGVDRAPYMHAKWLAKADKRLKVIEGKFLVEMENLIPKKPLTPEEYQKLIEKIKEIVKRHETEATYYWQALAYSVKALTGVSGALKTEDYAVFESLMDNIDKLYATDVKIGDLIINIQGRKLDQKDWDTICSYIEKYPYQKDVSQDKDRINMSITALLVHLMDANQRKDLILEFHKRNNRDVNKTSKLIKTFAETNIINIAQMRSLMTEITGSEYNMPPDEEKKILQRQEETMRLTQEVRRTMQSPLVINSAERMLNGRSLLACAAIAIGSMGMVMNYLSKFNKSKGLANRLTAGFASPYFFVSAAITAGGVHALGSTMRPGEAPGFLDKMFPKPKRLENPFGIAKNAEAQDASFTELVGLCTKYTMVEKYLFEADGFKDVMAFSIEKKADVKRMEEEAKIREVTKPKAGPKMDLFEEFMQFVEKNQENPKGKKELLKEIDKGYGRQAARFIFFRLFVTVHKVGINTARKFKNDKIPHQEFTYYDLYKHRAGLEPLKVAIKPAVETPAPAAATPPTTLAAPAAKPAPAAPAPAASAAPQGGPQPPAAPAAPQGTSQPNQPKK